MTPSELRFMPSAKPSISKNSRNLAVFYPGVPIESIVPNPVFINNTLKPHHLPIPLDFIEGTTEVPERLITSVYVTNKPASAKNGDHTGEFYENQE